MAKNLNDHRIRVTKLLIRQALTSLMAQKPMQSITIRELCALAGINRGTFYAHYQDIYALLEEIENEMLEAFEAALIPLMKTPPNKNSLVGICMGIFQCLHENSDMCIIMLGDYSDKNFVGRLLDLGKETCLSAYRQLFPSATITQLEYFYAYVSTGCMGLLRKWLEEGMLLTADELSDMTERLIMNGIGFLEQP